MHSNRLSLTHLGLHDLFSGVKLFPSLDAIVVVGDNCRLARHKEGSWKKGETVACVWPNSFTGAGRSDGAVEDAAELMLALLPETGNKINLSLISN